MAVEYLTVWLDEDLKAAGLNIAGVRVDDESDRTTWEVDWESPPSARDLATAQVIINNFDLTDGANRDAKVVDHQEHSGDMLRIVRGLVKVLIDNNVIARTDLPVKLRRALKQQ